MASLEGKKSPTDGITKRRACDECRSRKLACTKEPNGCSRCRREGIECHYSPQKPMGRPRKRRLVEDESSTTDAVDVTVATATVRGHDAQQDRHSIQQHHQHHSHASAPSAAPAAAPVSAFTPGDMSLSFLDESQSPNMDFFDLLPPDSYPNPHFAPQSLAVDPQILMPGDSTLDDTGYSSLTLNGVDLLSNINFDEPDPSTASLSKDISESLQVLWQTQDIASFDEPSDHMLSDLSNAADSPQSDSNSHPGQSSASSSSTPASLACVHESSSSTSQPSQEQHATQKPGLKPIPSVSCGCLSNLYYSLDSLSRLPPDIISAMRVARHATKVAHDTIRCPVCSEPLLENPWDPPPIQCFQNLMCLAALVPSACNAYAAILEMVDREHAAAKSQGRLLWFSLQDIGGLWGEIGNKHSQCDNVQHFNKRDMEPDLWRTTMRAVLRLDVYGFGTHPDDDNAAATTGNFMPGGRQPIHTGLKDVVRLLEERSRRRHDALDELARQGKLPKESHFLLHGNYKPAPPEERNCIKVLEAARMALDNLVIA